MASPTFSVAASETSRSTEFTTNCDTCGKPLDFVYTGVPKLARARKHIIVSSAGDSWWGIVCGRHCSGVRKLLPRDAMHSADYAVARCLSVRPSVGHTPVLCRNSYTIISSNFFSPSGSHTILVFPYKTVAMTTDWLIDWFRRRPPNVGAECKGRIKIAIFDQYLALSRKWYKIEP